MKTKTQGRFTFPGGVNLPERKHLSEEKKIETVSEYDDTAMSLWIAIKAANYVYRGFSFDFI